MSKIVRVFPRGRAIVQALSCQHEIVREDALGNPGRTIKSEQSKVGLEVSCPTCEEERKQS